MAVTSITAVAANKGTASVAAGNELVRYVDIVGPASYTNSGTFSTSGELLTQANLNTLSGRPGTLLGDIVSFDAENATGANSAGHSLTLDRVNGRVHYYNGTTEIANGVNLSTFTARVRVVHRVFAA